MLRGSVEIRTSLVCSRFPFVDHQVSALRYHRLQALQTPTGYTRGTKQRCSTNEPACRTDLRKRLEGLRRIIPVCPGTSIRRRVYQGAASACTFTGADLPTHRASQPDIPADRCTAARRRKEKDFLVRWLGYVFPTPSGHSPPRLSEQRLSV